MHHIDYTTQPTSRHYWGKECVNGHAQPDSPTHNLRSVSTNACIGCVRDRRPATANQTAAERLAQVLTLDHYKRLSEPERKAFDQAKRKQWVEENKEQQKLYQKDYQKKLRLTNPAKVEQYKQTQLDKGNGPNKYKQRTQDDTNQNTL
ncbi:hypothetical protein [Variovorax sp. LG9.2]|uniref:hypothetical protein n=1 Tax=Variovorax sp. LG9.2 TaxID=3048626 RepID=UPI002B22CF01|nr:hypothetical protein [Variovorax sp. LG9.2]MEB0057297.1 hypothetical protein [Variovorax sp. LG9.2]